MKGAPVKSLIDYISIEIPCQSCGSKMPETIGHLKEDNMLTSSCGFVTTVDMTRLNAEIKKIEKSFSEAGVSVRRIVEELSMTLQFG